jgi:hypothetical protein
MKFLSNFVEKIKKNKMTIGNGILYNKYLLYFILLISFTDLLYYAIAKKYIFIIIFFIIGYLTHFFSKNMTVIMCIALVFTNILSIGITKGSIVNEGLTNKKPNIKEKLNGSDDEMDDDLEDLKKVINQSKSTTKPLPKLPKPPSNNKKSNSRNKDEDKMGDDFEFEDEDEIEGLSDKTTELMKTQKELMKNMNTLAPMLEQAENFLEKFKKNENAGNAN